METPQQKSIENHSSQATSDTKIELTQQEKEAAAEMARQYFEEGRKMKAALKQLSKNQLIQLLIEQVNFAIEQQNVNKVLLERLKTQEQK